MQLLAVDDEHLRIACAANVRGAINHHLQDRLIIGDGVADCTQNFTDGGLPLQGFAQFTGAVFDLAFQPGVGFLQFGGHGVELVGQGFELVAGTHYDLLVEVAGTDLRRAGLQSANRLHQAAREEHACQPRQQQGGEQHAEGAVQGFQQWF